MHDDTFLGRIHTEKFLFVLEFYRLQCVVHDFEPVNFNLGFKFILAVLSPGWTFYGFRELFVLMVLVINTHVI